MKASHSGMDTTPPRETEPAMGALYYARLVLRGWWMVLLVVAVALGVTWLVLSQQQPVYRASTTFLVAPGNQVIGSSNEAVTNVINALARTSVLNTFAEIAISGLAVQEAAASLGYGESDIERLKRRAVVLPDTFAVQVSVEGQDPLRVAALANALVEQTGALGSASYPTFQIRPLDRAQPPVVPVRPQPVRDLALAGVSALLLGVVLAFAVEYLRDMLRARPRAAQQPLVMAAEPRRAAS